MKKIPIALIIISLFWLSSCSGSSQQAETIDLINIEMVTPLFPPIVGMGELVLQVTDAQTGLPISDAYLSVKGDMDHDGMVPVLSSAKAGTDGEYVIPFEWTMGGDWIVNINASLSDGSLVEKNLEMVVDGDEITCAPITD
ncbi:MAG: hypothetical protein DWQ04_29065 [Chloroflexi bacterium]|nr:MAG: hypothetical protein DWQ04_29065 [Chloroflexota bacterium]